ncbi:SprT family zinc-dependent metalloprotease [Marinomonas agarivorans]|nr:SprT family zinc-dependent metalloprotease [Marinomonas agarivorans]
MGNEQLLTVSDKQLIDRKVIQCIELANQFFGKNFSMPTVKLNQRGRAAGTAYLQRNEIRLNLYMYQQNPKKFIDTVIPHEVAHLLVFHLYGSKVRPHGREWQNIMSNLYDLTPDRTHDFTPKPPSQLFEYQCSCQKHTLSIRRHNKVKQGAQYFCRNCKAILELMNPC